MARQIYEFQFTIPAGTQIAAPAAMSMAIPVRSVQSLQVTVPPGPAGNVGFFISVGGGQVIPYQSGSYIITDDEKIDWPLDEYPDSGAWSITGYNLGIYDHTIYVRMLVQIAGETPDQITAPASNSGLSS